MNKNEHQADLNARALGADGELLFPGLTDDLGAQIAACDVVTLEKYCDGWQCWVTFEDTEPMALKVYGSAEYGKHGSSDPQQESIATMYAALTDAMFQATIPLAANWGECPECAIPEAHREHDDSFTGDCCHSTGIVLTGAKETI